MLYKKNIRQTNPPFDRLVYVLRRGSPGHREVGLVEPRLLVQGAGVQTQHRHTARSLPAKYNVIIT